jgi:DNA polymerase-4
MMLSMSVMSLDNALHPSLAYRWLYVDFNSYFASVEQQLNPRLRGKPVAVVPVQTDSTCAIAASYEAKAHGVRTGTPIYEAKKMCPGLIGVAQNRYLAKVATNLEKPDGFTLIAPSDLPRKLYALKLRDLPGIGPHMERRLQMAGINDMPALWALEPKRMRKIWGSVWGEKMWYLLRGVDLPEEETHRNSIGHSHVMAPELRDPAKAAYVARRLTLKAASRLRRLGYFASVFTLSARLEAGRRLSWEARTYRAQDSLTFLHLLQEGWATVAREARGARVKKVSVTLHGLTADVSQPELFDALPGVDLRARAKAERLSRALDKINHRFGRDSALVGMLPSQGKSFSGTKIAFTRIPDVEEFLE